MTGPTAARNALVDALHESIDGDYLLGGGGWGTDGWVDDIPHDQARISDIVRWAVNAILTSSWLQRHDAAVAAQALRDAAEDLGEDWVKRGTHPGLIGCYSPGYEHWLHRRADRIAAAPARRPDTQQGDGDG